MTIQVGSKLPQAAFSVMTAEGPTQFSTDDIFAGRKVVLIGIPGAYTPTCSTKHIPDFIARADEIKAKGVDTIACVSVNDVHVMTAWGKHMGADGKVMMLADGNGDFARAVGLDLDWTGLGMGIRSRRYVMIVEDGTMLSLGIDNVRGVVDESSVDAVLAAL